MRNRLTILLDFDDVITMYLEAIVDGYNKHHGTNHSVDKIQNWDLNHIFEKDIFETITYETLINAKEKGNSTYYIKKWIDEGNSVYIVSDTRDVISKQAKTDWLLERIPWFKKDHIIFIKNKYMIYGDVLVDDNIGNLKKWNDVHEDGLSLMMIATHNKDKAFVNNQVVSNFEEIDKKLSEYFE